MGRLFCGLVTASLLAANGAYAASAKQTASDKKYYETLKTLAPITTETPPVFNEAEAKEKIVKSEDRRSPAQSAGINEQQMSKELRQIRDQFLALTNSDELDAWIVNLETNYDSLPVDAKILASQVIPFRELRGFVYRLRSVFEKRANSVHSAILTVAKNTATNFETYLPSRNMDAVKEYFFSPFYRDGKLVASFNDEVDIQAFLTGAFLTSLKKSFNRLSVINLKDPVVWDQKFSFGPDSFQDNVNRFRFIGELEISLLKSAMAASIASLHVIRSYDVRGSIDLAKDIGHLYGIDGFLSEVDGVSAAKVTSKINKYPMLGTLLPEGGTESMKIALAYTRASAGWAWAAWNNSSKERKNEDLYALDSGYWRVNRKDIEHNLTITYNVISSNQQENLRSAVTGEIISVKFADIFTNPPKDLKAFLPTQFDQARETKRLAVVKGSGKSAVKKELTYRNYSEGSAKAWNFSAFDQYFPNTKSKEDVLKISRVLSHAGGNWLFLAR